MITDPESHQKPLTAREKIAKLRTTFLEQLPTKLLELRALLVQLMADPMQRTTAIELHRVLHSLKGTGSSFGFRELGVAAGLGEDLTALLIVSTSSIQSQQWLEALSRNLYALEGIVAKLCDPAASTVAHHESSFDLSMLPVVSNRTVSDSHGSDRVIYLCDDEVLVLEQLASQLSCFGYKTVAFDNLQTLREAVLARQPDAVVMDIHFPQSAINGTEMLALLNQEVGSPIPAIFLSSRNDFEARLAAVQAGGEAYFQKPARPIDLVAVLDELTRQQQPEPYRILVIDDEAEIASYHSIILQEAGMLTYQLVDPSLVLEVLREFRPDMVLMDMYMPTCSGRDLAKLIRQVPDHVGLPIVYLSSETDRQKQFSAMRIGAEGFLTKPVIPEDLVAAVGIRAERMRTLHSLMARDSLTGLFNHTTTTQLLENTITMAKRSAGTLCFVMIDIDRFKSVNDTHGHPTGDQVLLALSRLLQQRLRNSDIVGRYGGEEFAVILQNVPVQSGAKLINELRKDFSRIIFSSEQGEFSCSFSAGIASFSDHRRMDLLREAADKALYEAKRSGRNCVIVD